MPKLATGVKAKPASAPNESLNNVLVSLSQAISSKIDLVQVIRHSLRSAVHFSDLVITRFNLQKGTYTFFLESCDLNVQDSDIHSMVLQEHPMVDGVQDVIMHSEHSMVFSVQDLPKNGIIHT
ncbi:MAG TPA: hypothetical protein VFI33_05270, partial [Puia sp.]|nr:hypothetical protein [Puia sp.]